MEILKGNSFVPYRATLIDLFVRNVKHLKELEPGIFHGLKELRTIYIHTAPQLTTIAPDVFAEDLPSLKVLRIMHTGLQVIPYLGDLRTEDILSVIDLDNNDIRRIPSHSFEIQVEQLVLNYNNIEIVEDFAFFNSQIAKLSIKGNSRLTTISANAFTGLKSIRDLDLSGTSITILPTNGLQELDVLHLENTDSLTIFPSVYTFQKLQEAWLTYPYHCCAFQFPAQHDPAAYARHQEFLLELEQRCSKREKRWTAGDWGSAHGTFHQDKVTISPIKQLATCGQLSKNYHDVRCFPAPDAFNPCEDVMGNWALRAAVWIVCVAALFGNATVLLVLLSSTFPLTVPRFLMCNLGIADLCMGLYLLLLALMDAHSVGDYFNHAISWQKGPGCQIAGFLTVFASELSIFTLTVITGERWYTITYAIHLNKRLRIATAVKIMAFGWIYSVTMALLPIFGVSGYSKTSICLPMENKGSSDIAYLATLLTFNALAFIIICTCYGRMYCSIRGGQDAVAALTRSDMTVAKRMAMLVFTDFACWAPIAFFGLTALSGYPLIDVPKTKILLVFFYPLNSCANPYLYALLTRQYRRDLLALLNRYGICTDRTARYKGTVGISTRECVDNLHCTGPNHRGSLLTTVTSMDGSGTRPSSLKTVPEQNHKMEMMPVEVPQCYPLGTENSHL